MKNTLFSRLKYLITIILIGVILSTSFITIFVYSAPLNNEISTISPQNVPNRQIKKSTDNSIDSNIMTQNQVLKNQINVKEDLFPTQIQPMKFPINNNFNSKPTLNFDYSWANTSFVHRKNITIDSTMVSGSTNLTDFPLLLDMYDTDLAVDVQATGADILFTDDTGTQLDHEIELFNQSYNQTHAHLVSWIRVPSLSPSSDTTLTMYFGNNSVSSQENSSGVWNNDYEFVLHFNQDPSVSDILDSTSNGFNFENASTMTASDLITSQLGNAITFDGIDDFLYLPTATGFSGPTTQFSMIFWISLPNGGPSTQSHLSRPASVGDPQLYFENGQFVFQVDTNGACNEDCGSLRLVSNHNSFTANTWFYIAVVFKSAGSGLGELYIDGALDNNISNLWWEQPHDSWNSWSIGAEDNGSVGGTGTSFLEVTISDFQLVNTVRSSDWIATEYTNQFSPDLFYNIGVEEVYDLVEPILVDFGVDDQGLGVPIFWANITDVLSPIANATIQFDNVLYNMFNNGSLWRYINYSVNTMFNGNFSYQIMNASDQVGNFLITPSIVSYIVLDRDNINPQIVNTPIFEPNYSDYGRFRVNVTDSWGLIDTVIVNVTSQGPFSAIMQYNSTSGEFTNDTLQVLADSFSYDIIINDTSGNSVTFVDYDGTSTGIPPSVDNLMLSPNPLLSNTSITLDYTYSDPDILTVYNIESGTEIRWYKDGILQSQYNDTKIIPASATTKGEIWNATVRPNDGIKFGNLKTSGIISVINTPPEASFIKFSPNSFTFLTTDNLTASYGYFDNDNDAENISNRLINWFRSTNGTFVLQVSLSNSLTLNSSMTAKNEQWFYNIQLFDSFIYSTQYLSPIISIINSAPEVINPVIEPVYIFDDDTFTVNWNFVDVDFDSEVLSVTIVQWFRNGILVPELSNLKTVPANFTEPGQSWVAEIQVFDGASFSSRVQTSPISIVTIEFNYPISTYEEFLLDSEDIRIEFIFSDQSLEAIKNQSIFSWLLNGGTDDRAVQFSGELFIPASATQPGDVWTLLIIPFNGAGYGSIITSKGITIESIPTINNYGVEPELDSEGDYIFWVNVSDTQHEIESVEIELQLSDEISQVQLATFNGSLWIVEFELEDYIDTEVSVTLTATTKVFYNMNSIEINNDYEFNYTLIDIVPPRIIDVILIYDNEIQPNNVTFIVEIEEFGSGIEEILLFYEFVANGQISNLTSNTILGSSFKLSQNDTGNQFIYSLVLVAINDTYYTGTVEFSPEEETIIQFQIQATDKAGNSNPFAFPDGLNQDFKNNKWTPPVANTGFGIGLEIVALIILTIVIFSFIAIKKFRVTELVGLNKELVISTISELNEEDIVAALHTHSLGIVVSFFDQRLGPVPIIVKPDILYDSYESLVTLSDLSFNTAQFTNNFNTENISSFSFILPSELVVHSLTFSFALNRPNARGGAENITLNLILYQEFAPLINQFLNEFKTPVNEIHLLMDNQGDQKDKVLDKVKNLRRFASSIILAHEKLYGTTDLITNTE